MNDDNIYYSFPPKIDISSGGWKKVDKENYYKQLIEQLLFTRIGERVHSKFGTNIADLLFEPLNDELVLSTQFLVQSAIQQWLGDIITVVDVKISSENSVLNILISYTLVSELHNNVPRQVAFTKEMR